MKRAAITGIAGQDGTYLGRWLLRQGYSVAGLLQFPFDREEPGLRRRHTPEEMSAVQWMNGSLEDPFSLVRFLKLARPTEIYHLAGLTDSRQSFGVPEESVLAITLGTLRLLEAAREICPDARVFLASSAEVFGAPPSSPQDESTPRQPITPYGIAKVAADQFGRLHRDHYSQYVSVGILYNHESPLRPPNYLSSRVARAVAAIKQGRMRELQLGDLTPQRDWGDARDFVRGFHLSLQAKLPSDYVFASGQPRCVADLVDIAFRGVGLDYREYVKSTSRNASSPQAGSGLCGNPARAEAVLGWRRQWSLEDTVRDMVQAEMENRPEVDRAQPDPKRA
jgi:GDPmannose 4,6-dehydratase